MAKKQLKLYGFKLKGENMVNLFNASDLFGYEKDNGGKWQCNGFSWLVNNPTYIIDSFYDFFSKWDCLTVSEFDEIIASDEDLSEYDCAMLSADYPIEKLFGLSVEYADINTTADIEKYPRNATFTDMATINDYDEPMYYSFSEMVYEIEDNGNGGRYRVIY